MWHRLTKRGRHLFTCAQEEGARRGASGLEPEHLLYGMLRDETSLATYILTRLGATAEQIRAELDRHCPPATGPGDADIQPSPAGERVLELAGEEANRHRHIHIGTEHILLALLQDSEGLAGRVLTTVGIDLERVRQVMEAPESGKTGGAPPSIPQTEEEIDAFCRFMVEKGYLSQQRAFEAQIAQKLTRRDIRQILIQQGEDPFHIYLAYADARGEPAIDLLRYTPSQEAIDAMHKSIAWTFNVLPLKKDGDTLYIAMGEIDDERVLGLIGRVLKCTVRGVWAVPQHITVAIERYYPKAGTEGVGAATAGVNEDAIDMAAKLADLERKILDKRRAQLTAASVEDVEAEVARFKQSVEERKRTQASAFLSEVGLGETDGDNTVSQAQRALQAVIHDDRTGWRGRSLVTLQDVSAAQVREVLDVAARFKALQREGYGLYFDYPKTLALLFEKPSLRTRVSFEAGMMQLTGRAIYLAPGDVGLGVREPVADVAACLSRWVDVIAARTFKHRTVEELAANATVPVINALSDREHPIQAFADLLTIQEAKGDLGNHLKVAYVGDGNNVLHALLLACVKVGVNVTAACPEGYRPDSAYVAEAQRIGIGEDGTGAQIEVVNDPIQAVQGADVIYTDVWTSMGQEEESAERRRIFAPYRVDAALLRAAKSDVIALHCLPAHRDEEISTEVMDAYWTTIQDQAENRLHTQKALIALMLGLA